MIHAGTIAPSASSSARREEASSARSRFEPVRSSDPEGSGSDARWVSTALTSSARRITPRGSAAASAPSSESAASRAGPAGARAARTAKGTSQNESASASAGVGVRLLGVLLGVFLVAFVAGSSETACAAARRARIERGEHERLRVPAGGGARRARAAAAAAAAAARLVGLLAARRRRVQRRGEERAARGHQRGDPAVGVRRRLPRENLQRGERGVHGFGARRGVGVGVGVGVGSAGGALRRAANRRFRFLDFFARPGPSAPGGSSPLY